MAELFQTSKQNVGQHLKNIFADGELKEGSVVKKFFTTAADSKNYSTAFYNLDAIISVGYRVQSHIMIRLWKPASSFSKRYKTNCIGPLRGKQQRKSSREEQMPVCRIWG